MSLSPSTRCTEIPVGISAGPIDARSISITVMAANEDKPLEQRYSAVPVSESGPTHHTDGTAANFLVASM